MLRGLLPAARKRLARVGAGLQKSVHVNLQDSLVVAVTS